MKNVEQPSDHGEQVDVSSATEAVKHSATEQYSASVEHTVQPEDLATAGGQLMQRLVEQVHQHPSLKKFLVIVPLLAAPQAQAGGLWEDLGGIVRGVVVDTVSRETRQTTSEVEYGVYDKVYKQCDKLSDDTARRMCDKIMRRSTDRVLRSVTSRY